MKLWQTILLGNPRHPNIPNLREVRDDSLYPEGLIRGTIIAGDQGTGKTQTAKKLICDFIEHYPQGSVIVLDASGGLSDDLIEHACLLPPGMREAILNRIVLDLPGDSQQVLPRPFFSAQYQLTREEQVQRGARLFRELNAETLIMTPMMATAIRETAPELFRLLAVVRNERGGSWQLTEAKTLLQETFEGGQLYRGCKLYGQLVPEAKWYFEQLLLRDGLTAISKEARTVSLINALQVLESPPMRARFGHPVPGITMQEIIDQRLIYIVNGANLINQKDAQAFVFWDVFSNLQAHINKRIPHDPSNHPVLLVIDESHQLFKIPGMAEILGEIPTLYRSRQLLPVLIYQADWQLADKLLAQSRNFGNLVLFSLSNFDDALAWSKQLFTFPRQERDPSSWRSPESDGHLYRLAANWLQRLQWRQVVMRRYLNERDRESFVSFVHRTSEKLSGHLPSPLDITKEDLFRRRTVDVRAALAAINQREMPPLKRERRTVNGAAH